MKIGTRKDLAFFLAIAGAGLCVVAHFISGAVSWWLTGGLIASGFVLVGVGAVVAPPFWWGNRSFTTPLKDPSHEARRQDAT
jgi:hypothetical protein